jgi:hypothetical protein
MSIIRAQSYKDRQGFSMPRLTAQDGKRNGPLGLSFEARGVLVYLLSKPDDWIIQYEDLMAEGGIGRDKAKSILTQLRKAGYIVTAPLHDADGKFAGKEEILNETSILPDRHTENPYTGKTGQRKNRHIHKKESLQKKELKESLDASLSSETPNETTTNSTSERDDEVIPAPAAPVEVKVVPQRKPGSFGALHPELSDEELDALAAKLEAEEAVKKQKLLELNTANAAAEEELYVAVREVFGAGGGEIGEAGNYVRMLRGKMKIGRKKKKLAPDTWDEMSTLFKDEPVDAEELRDWAAAWKLANKDASMVKDPVRVASSIDARRQSGRVIGVTKSATDGFRPIDTTVQQIDRRLLL